MKIYLSDNLCFGVGEGINSSNILNFGILSVYSPFTFLNPMALETIDYTHKDA